MLIDGDGHGQLVLGYLWKPVGAFYEDQVIVAERVLFTKQISEAGDGILGILNELLPCLVSDVLSIVRDRRVRSNRASLTGYYFFAVESERTRDPAFTIFVGDAFRDALLWESTSMNTRTTGRQGD